MMTFEKHYLFSFSNYYLTLGGIFLQPKPSFKKMQNNVYVNNVLLIFKNYSKYCQDNVNCLFYNCSLYLLFF